MILSLAIHLRFLHIILVLPIWAHAATPDLKSDTDVANAGYYRLSWQIDASAASEFVLAEGVDARMSNAKILYRGPDTATIVSGRGNGDYFYRVKALTETGETPWSEAVKVEVRHHTLDRAWLFFAVGATVFVATLAVTLLGNRHHRS